MLNDDGKRGSRPGQTRTERMERARAGAYRGKQYAKDGVCEPGYGAPPTRLAGQGTTFTKPSPISSPRTGNSPYEQQQKVKPGSGL